MKQLWILNIKRSVKHTRGGCIFQCKSGIKWVTETKKFYRKEEIEVPDLITCLLFVRMVLCKSYNIRIIRGMHAVDARKSKKRRWGWKFPWMRVLPYEGARTCGRNRGVVLERVSECRGQSTDFGADITEFQWTHWPRKPIAVYLSISLFVFFLLLCFEKPEDQDFHPYLTRCCGSRRPSTEQVCCFDNDTL